MLFRTCKSFRGNGIHRSYVCLKLIISYVFVKKQFLLNPIFASNKHILYIYLVKYEKIYLVKYENFPPGFRCYKECCRHDMGSLLAI